MPELGSGMRVGVLGLGYWGAKHVRVLSSSAQVDAVVCADPRFDRRRAIQNAYPSVQAVDSTWHLLDAVDAVVIATGPRSHVSLARQALAAGRHVLVEKPLAMDVVAAESLAKDAEARGLVLMVGHTFAYNAAVERLGSDAAAGHLGSIQRIHCERLNLGQHQADCDVLWDLGPHDISIVLALTKRMPSTIQAFGRGHVNPAVVDDAHMLLEFGKDGPQAVVHVSWLDPRKVRRVTVVGSHRMAVFDDLRDEERLRFYDKGAVLDDQDDSHSMPISYRYGDITAPLLAAHEPLRREDEHFIDCVKTGARPLTDGWAGVDVTRVLAAASASLANGSRRVDLL